MITILTGKSGCGKDTLLNELVQRGTFMPLISTTTRPMRDGETNGKEYHFISKEEFFKKVKEKDFLEYRAYNTSVNGNADIWYYGSPKLSEAEIKNNNIIVVLDLQGAKDYLNHYGKENCQIILLDVNDEIRRERAIRRGSFDETEWKRRLEDDTIKFSKEAIKDIVNIYLNNDGNIKDLADIVENTLSEKNIDIDTPEI